MPGAQCHHAVRESANSTADLVFGDQNPPGRTLRSSLSTASSQAASAVKMMKFLVLYPQGYGGQVLSAGPAEDGHYFGAEPDPVQADLPDNKPVSGVSAQIQRTAFRVQRFVAIVIIIMLRLLRGVSLHQSSRGYLGATPEPAETAKRSAREEFLARKVHGQDEQASHWRFNEMAQIRTGHETAQHSGSSKKWWPAGQVGEANENCALKLKKTAYRRGAFPPTS
jgi:hypothetical protein